MDTPRSYAAFFAMRSLLALLVVVAGIGLACRSDPADPTGVTPAGGDGLGQHPAFVPAGSGADAYAYMSNMVKIAILRHEAAGAQGASGAGGGLRESLVVDVEVHPTRKDDSLWGRITEKPTVGHSINRLRRYLTDNGATIIGGGIDYTELSARAPVSILRELAELPYVNAILVRQMQVPGLTDAEASKLEVYGFADVIAAHEAGVTLWSEDDPMRPRWFGPGNLATVTVMVTGTDEATAGGNARQVAQFLAGNGAEVIAIVEDPDGYPEVAIITSVPPPLLKRLAETPEVSELRIAPPWDGPAGPQVGPQQGPQFGGN